MKNYDEIIRAEIETATTEAVEEGTIIFPDEASRDEFMKECFAEIEYQREHAETVDSLYSPDYESIISDMARVYGYFN